jgi:TatD family-associated radical SAM protein
MVRDEKPRTVYWLDDKLYLNITNKCSNKCIFCFRNFKRGIGDFMLKLSAEPSFEQIAAEFEAAMRRKVWKEVVFCGFGEPTERLDLLLTLARCIKGRYGKPVLIRVNTNGHGYVLNAGKDVAAELKAAGVDKVSVSLNAGDEETYNAVCKPVFAGAYAAVLDFIEKAKCVLEVEVTAVTTPEVDLHIVEAIAKQMSVTFRLRQCVPCFW